MRHYFSIRTVNIIHIWVVFDIHFISQLIIFIMEGYGVFELLDKILIDGFAAL